MGELAPFITAFTTAVSVLAGLWIYRRTNRFDTLHFVFAVGVMLYTFYHYYVCGVLGILDPVHSAITGLFISSVAITNAYCSTCNTIDNVINIGVCRRKDLPGRRDDNPDRRKVESHTIFKSVEH